MTANSETGNDFWRAMRWLPFVVTVIIRLIALSSFIESPLFLPIGGDRGLYHDAACAIASGVHVREVFTFLPFYPYLLGSIYALIGSTNLAAAGIANAILDGFTAMMILHAATRRYGNSAGLLAGFGFAFLGVASEYSLVSMPLSLGLFWTMLIVTLSDRWDGAMNPAKSAALGLALGAGGQILGAFWLMIIPFGVRTIILSARQPPARRFLLGIITILCGYSCILPTLAHNAIRGGEFVAVTAHGGLNLYLGNNPAAKGYGVALPGARLSAREMTADARAMASDASGTPLNMAQADRFWRMAALDFWMEHPARGLVLLVRKAHRLVSVNDFDDTGLCRLLRRAPIRNWAFLGFGAVWLLACAGISWRSSQHGNGTLWIMGTAFAAGALMTFVTARYRIPLAVLMLPAAGGTLARLPGWLRDFARNRTQPAMSIRIPLSSKVKVAVSIAGISLALIPHSMPDTQLPDALNRSAHFLQAGKNDQARREAYDAAIAYPYSPDALFALGNSSMAMKDFEAAAQAYAKVAEFAPRRADAMFNAAFAFRELGNTAEARSWLLRAVAADPGHVKAWFALAEICRETGDPTGARNAIERASEFAGPDHPQIIEFLGQK